MTRPFHWPAPGTRRAFVGRTSIRLPDDAPVQYWVCCRVDEPDTWRHYPNQHLGGCARCGAAIVYRVMPDSPTDPGVQKICRRCCLALADADAAGG